jgi:hypothetical protein
VRAATTAIEWASRASVLRFVAGVEDPDPCSELGRHVDDVLTGLEQPLRQRPTGAQTPLDRPCPVRTRGNVLPHRGEASLVGAEPTGPSRFSPASMTSIVADSLWGSTPMMTLPVVPLALCREPVGRRGGHRYYELGSPLLGHASSQRPTVRKPESSHTLKQGGQPRIERPAERLDRVWPDTGPARSL